MNHFFVKQLYHRGFPENGDIPAHWGLSAGIFAFSGNPRRSKFIDLPWEKWDKSYALEERSLGIPRRIGHLDLEGLLV